MTFILAVIFIVVLKFLINIIAYFQTSYYLDQYGLWLREEPCADLLQARSKVKKLVKEAGIDRKILPVVQPMGFFKLASMEVEVLDQFPSNRSDFFGVTLTIMREAMGIYKTRAWESFNPLYWIKFIINLPKNVISYIGFNADTALTRLLQIVWWVASTLMFVIYQDEVSSFVKRIVKEVIDFI